MRVRHELILPVQGGGSSRVPFLLIPDVHGGLTSSFSLGIRKSELLLPRWWNSLPCYEPDGTQVWRANLEAMQGKQGTVCVGQYLALE